MYNNSIFREYDIRGKYQIDFDDKFAFLLGKAFARYINKSHPIIAVGYDARASSPDLATSLISGFNSSGANVIHLGLVTTPMTYFAGYDIPNLDGAIMITGSHNPVEYNGFKVTANKKSVYGQEIQKLRTIIESLSANIFVKEGIAFNHDISTEYIKQFENQFSGLQFPKVVFDCGNGVAGVVLRKICEKVGLDATILFEEPDGTFPNHHPDPSVHENLQDLIKEVKETGSDVGIAFDGDVDRIGVVDSNGDMIMGDELLILYARHLLPENPGRAVVGDVKCSNIVYEEIEKLGGKPVMWKTGHSLIKEKIKSEDALFGGELSGHMFFNDRNHGYDDAIYAAFRLLEILSKTQKSIAELLFGIKKMVSTPEIRVDIPDDIKFKLVEYVKSAFQDSRVFKLNDIDGVRLSCLYGWALLRASNTQPAIVMRFEADTEENLDVIRSAVYKEIKKFNENT